MSAVTVPVDMIRLAALLGRLEPQADGVCRTAGCTHDHGPVAAAGAGREAALAA